MYNKKVNLNPLSVHFNSLQNYNIEYFDKGGLKAIILFDYLITMGKIYHQKRELDRFFHSQRQIQENTFISVSSQRPILDDFEFKKKLISREYGGDRNTARFKIHTDEMLKQLEKIYDFKKIEDIEKLKKFFEF